MRAARAMALGAWAGGAAGAPCPVADGGEGSLDVLAAALRATVYRAEVTGPLGVSVRARYAVAGDLGIVELAEASGLGLVPLDRRDPTATTTYGTGELIAAAMERGCAALIVCVGGSATVDGGAGLAQALGGRFTDRDGRAIEKPLTGADLAKVAGYAPPPTLPRIRVACDVGNPLLGPDGAAAVYGPQKGATPRQVEQLEAGLRRLAEVAGGGPDRPGAGASGGAGFGLAALCGASLEPGIDLVLDAIGFERRCRDADLVVTGEGRLDAQSRYGKACAGVAQAARRLNVPAAAIAGQVEPGAGFGDLFRQVVSLSDRYGVDQAMNDVERLLVEATADLVRGCEPSAISHQ